MRGIGVSPLYSARGRDEYLLRRQVASCLHRREATHSTTRHGGVITQRLNGGRISMTEAIARAGSWLLLQAAAAPDTILMRQVGAEPTIFQKITGIASALLTVVILVVAVALVPAAWNFRKTYKKVSDLLDKVYGDVQPLVRHVSGIADDINYVTTSIRTDIQQINATIATANQRLNEGIEATEARLRDFQALLAVVQEEAEQMFVSTASTVRGVRTGAAALRHPDGMEFAMEDDAELDDLDEDEVDDEIEDEVEDELDDSVSLLEEEPDGDDSDTEPAPRSPARPRVRPRRRHG